MRRKVEEIEGHAPQTLFQRRSVDRNAIYSAEFICGQEKAVVETS